MERFGRSARVTITDVAQHLGVTKSTVSRALNGYPDIAFSTRVAVQDAAQAMGYRPLRPAQAIRTGRVRSLGLVLQADHHDAYRAFLSDFLVGVTEAVAADDWTVNVATAASGPETLDLISRLAGERRADGFILPRTLWQDDRAAHLIRHDIPFVLFGRQSDLNGCAWFDVEGEAAIEEAVERLAALGHRRIGFIQGGDGFAYSVLRLQGYLDAVAACGCDADRRLISGPAVDRRAGAEAARALMASAQPPTAIVAAVDFAAMGAISALRELGLSVPDDVSVIGYDGVDDGQAARPRLSTFNVDLRHAGARLAKLLIRRIEGASAETLHETVRAPFLAGETHGRKRIGPAELAAKIDNQTATREKIHETV